MGAAWRWAHGHRSHGEAGHEEDAHERGRGLLPLRRGEPRRGGGDEPAAKIRTGLRALRATRLHRGHGDEQQEREADYDEHGADPVLCGEVQGGREEVDAGSPDAGARASGGVLGGTVRGAVRGWEGQGRGQPEAAHGDRAGGREARPANVAVQEGVDAREPRSTLRGAPRVPVLFPAWHLSLRR